MNPITNTQLPVLGYGERVLPNSFLRHESGSDHIVFLFPGFAYGADRPLLHYSARLLTDLGADVLRHSVQYGEYSGFSDLSESERSRLLITDGLALIEAGFSQREYRRVTLVGKSIGTLVAVRLLVLERRLSNAECILHTPLLQRPRFMEMIESKRPRALFTIGTVDPHYDVRLLERAETATGGRSVVVEGADHSLEIPGQVSKSIEALQSTVSEMERFLGEGGSGKING